MTTTHLQITRRDGTLQATLKLPDGRVVPLAPPALDGTAEIGVKGRSFTLDRVMEAMIRHRREEAEFLFDERGQLEIGHHLYHETLGGHFGEHPPSGEQLLRIETPHEEIARLPWALMAAGPRFLFTEGWSVVIQGSDLPPHDILLPPIPRLLIVAPQPNGVSDTQATAHLEELRTELARYLPAYREGPESQLRVVTDWAALTTTLPEFKPDVLYYYGHGVSRDGEASTRLVFAGDAEGGRDDRPVGDLTDLIKQLSAPPLIAYINCCRGDAGGLLGVGRQLEDEAQIPAVITNRTEAKIPAARAQAVQLWSGLLIRGLPPHQAVNDLYRDHLKLGLTSGDLRRLTPRLHGHYGRWHTSGDPQPTPDPDPHWSYKIDRVSQYAEVDSLTRLMLREGKPRCRAFVWYGGADDGVDRFHRRLEIELREGLAGMRTAFLTIAPDWPEILGETTTDAYYSFQEKMLEAFDVDKIRDIPLALASRTPGFERVLAYIRPPSVHSVQLINPETLRIYLACWEEFVLPILEPNQFVLSTTSFIVKKPGAFQNAMEEEEIDEEDFQHTVFALLDGMDNLMRKDLRVFLRTHDIGLPDDLPSERLNELLDEILERTGGSYEQTVAQLSNLQQLLRAAERRRRASKPKRKKYDYD